MQDQDAELYTLKGICIRSLEPFLRGQELYCLPHPEAASTHPPRLQVAGFIKKKRYEIFYYH